ncbi:MAG: hypothetical protein J5525_12695 [Lachnospiraceae bacterium]|nr:hypothetical protein [Lachnospiraceae bacterium]
MIVKAVMSTALSLLKNIPDDQKGYITVIDNVQALKTDSKSVEKCISEGSISAIVAWHGYLGLDENKPISGIIDSAGKNYMMAERLNIIYHLQWLH